MRKSLTITATLLLAAILFGSAVIAEERRPNILFAISDDQSFPHTSAYGYPAVKTPAFDSVAKAGVLFENAFAPSPGCSPSRAAMLTGRYPWQLEHAGTHASEFPAEYIVYPDLLENAGYWIGYTGKGWGPGNFKVSDRTRNPAGPKFSSETAAPPQSGISKNDYAENFRKFLNQRPEGKPFYFWYGASEPHRVFQKGAGIASGKKTEDATPPPFLPDTQEIRSDLLDYCTEIEHFDNHLGKMIEAIKEAGELDNTIIIVTSDNGMAFPRAKANLYEYGIHLPLAIAWPDKIPGNRKVDDIVNLIDVAPTILEATGIAFPEDAPEMSARSLGNTLYSESGGRVDPTRNLTFSSRERHSSSRWNNLAYPQRCVRTDKYLYIRNFKPERWPAGAPQKFESDGTLGPMHGGYHDIDACPTMSYMIEHMGEAEVAPLFHAAIDHRPAEELYDIKNDPGCLENLAENAEYAPDLNRLGTMLHDYLVNTGDPRATDEDGGEIFESYKRYSPIRKFPKPEWAE